MSNEEGKWNQKSHLYLKSEILKMSDTYNEELEQFDMQKTC